MSTILIQSSPTSLLASAINQSISKAPNSAPTSNPSHTKFRAATPPAASVYFQPAASIATFKANVLRLASVTQVLVAGRKLLPNFILRSPDKTISKQQKMMRFSAAQPTMPENLQLSPANKITLLTHYD